MEITRKYRHLGSSLRVLDTIESTNSRLKAEAESGQIAGGAVLVAEFQSEGRGRFSRRWDAPPGRALLFSMLLYPDLEPDRIQLLGLLASLGVLDGILHQLDRLRSNYPRNGLTLKWPNDILANNRKLCGILSETGLDRAQRRFAVVGVGLNVNQSPDEFPRYLHSEATSLYVVTGEIWERDKLLEEILARLDDYYHRLTQEGTSWIAPLWLKRAGILDRKLTVQVGDDEVSGVCLGLETDGSLLLKLAEGDIRRIHSGDVMADSE